MRKAFLIFIAFFPIIFFLRNNLLIPEADSRTSPPPVIESPPSHELLITIEDEIRRDETLYDIFKRYELDMQELYLLKNSTKDVYNINRLALGHSYSITYDSDRSIRSVTYCINDNSVLNIIRNGDAFCANRMSVPYETRVAKIGGTIKDNLVTSLDNLLLALDLSDIFAWDIDFTTDIRKGDTFRIVVEELWLDGEFRKYGNILSAEFVNNGNIHKAYRYEIGGRAGYFDSDGKSLRRAFLKAPLNYRRISSGFTKRRFHPILKRYRPHLGVDYAAPTGTPVSSVGDGIVVFAGYKGQNGKMVVIKHPVGYTTYYGHLSRIAKGIRKGRKVHQGQVIGSVGSTGLATGPHLDYRVKRNGNFLNPLRLKMPRSKSVNNEFMADFTHRRDEMDSFLNGIKPDAIAERKGSPQEG